MIGLEELFCHGWFFGFIHARLLLCLYRTVCMGRVRQQLEPGVRGSLTARQWYQPQECRKLLVRSLGSYNPWHRENRAPSIAHRRIYILLLLQLYEIGCCFLYNLCHRVFSSSQFYARHEGVHEQNRQSSRCLGISQTTSTQNHYLMIEKLSNFFNHHQDYHVIFQTTIPNDICYSWGRVLWDEGIGGARFSQRGEFQTSARATNNNSELPSPLISICLRLHHNYSVLTFCPLQLYLRIKRTSLHHFGAFKRHLQARAFSQ